MKKIKAMVFDVGGVLQIGPKTRFGRKEIHVSGVHEIIAKRLGISIDQYFDIIDSNYAKSMEGIISKKELLKNLSINFKLSKERLEKLYFLIYKKKYKKNKKLYSIVKKLKKQGYLLAILSDQWHLSKRAQISKEDYSIFDKVVISCEVGMRKPNREIYKLILRQLKVFPEEVIFIDNQSWNIIPAHKEGMNTILFVNNNKTKKQLKDFGVKL